MNLVEFLTSKEIIVVYIVAFVACLLCYIIYLVEKNNVKALQRHNTKELNKLVSKVKEEIHEEEVVVENREPVLQVIETVESLPKVEEKVEVIEEVPTIEENIEVIEETPTIEEKNEVVEEKTEELEYTTIEPDQATARLEIQKITEELKKQEEILESDNIPLTNYEEEQEENAIISLEELVKRGKDIYEVNEMREYSEDDTMPISIQELEKQVGREASKIEDTFIIENVVSEDELNDSEPVITNVTPVVMEKIDTPSITEVVSEEKEANEIRRFKSSPIISPIFGIEKEEVSENELELENTADYEKLDAEIKKTNEFLMTLRELQQKLD